MYQAAYYLDADVMNELIAQIPKSNSSLAKALTDSINNFNCDRILELIQSLEISLAGPNLSDCSPYSS